MTPPIPDAKTFFLAELMPDFFRAMSYEEYVVETSKKKGTLKKPLPHSELDYYAKNSLATMQFSNSIEINFACVAIHETVRPLRDFLESCYIAVVPETDINAGAHYVNPDYSGHIIDLGAGTLNWFNYFLAPLVTLAWVMDKDTSETERESMTVLLGEQLDDLSYLTENKDSFSAINRLSRPSFPRKEMYVEHVYYKQGTFIFILLHELGHHALKHTKESPLGLFEADVSAYVSSQPNGAHADEFEADFFANRSILEAVSNRGFGAEQQSVSIELNSVAIGGVLALMGIAYSSKEFFKASKSHPSLEKRLSACVGFYLSEFAKYGTEFGMQLCEMFSSVLPGDRTELTSLFSVRR